MKTIVFHKTPAFKFLFRTVLPILAVAAVFQGLTGCVETNVEADFTASSTTINQGGSIEYIDASKNADSYVWTFAGGTPSSASTKGPHTVVYPTAGTFNVTLTADGNGVPTSKTIQITVNAVLDAPVAAFTASLTGVQTGDDVDFTDQSTNSPTSWAWTFEGGVPATSTDQNPTEIVYNAEGTFDVTLIATNVAGNDTEIKVDYITVTAIPFCTPVTDVDGNTYQVIAIGNHCWMMENLKTSKYRNGNSIVTGLNLTDWLNDTEGAYQHYDNNPANNDTYGKLYNWHAINNSNGICPDDWHVATDAEWTDLYNALGGILVANPKMCSTTGWTTNSGNNSSGFTALPGGLFGTGGQFGGLGSQAYFWSATESDANSAFSAQLYNGGDEVYHWALDKNAGVSCRCVKD